MTVIKANETKSINPKEIELVKIPTSHIVFANIINWVTIGAAVLALFAQFFILADESNNMLNPGLVFGAVFDGTSVDKIWSMSTIGSFPGAHFYLGNMSFADSWGDIAINLGCTVGLFALAPTIIIQIFKEKKYVQAFLGLVFFILILLSTVGLLSVSAE